MTRARYKVRVRPCVKCGTDEQAAFGWYQYTMANGGRSERRDSVCRACRRTARLQHYHANPAKDRARAKKWKRANAAHMALYAAKRQQFPAVRAMKATHQRARKARMRAGVDGHEDPRILALYREAKNEETKLRACVACDDDLELQVHVDHIIPLARGGKHVFENLQILSGRENLEKGARL